MYTWYGWYRRCLGNGEDQDGKLSPTEDLRDVVLVAGEDPYAWKGIIDANQPYLRPEVLKIKTGVEAFGHFLCKSSK